MPSDACAAHDVTALILGAGDGQRLGGRPKAFIDYQNQTLLAHAISLVSPWAARVVVTVRDEDLPRARQHCAALPEGARITCVAGGATRQESLWNALCAADTPYLLVHEVARPWVQAEDFRRLLTAVSEKSAVVLCTRIPVRDTVALAEDGKIVQILPRSSLIALQTPHAYQLETLRRVYTLAQEHHWEESGTAGLVRRAGVDLHLVEGSPQNVKITYPQDLAALESPVGMGIIQPEPAAARAASA